MSSILETSIGWNTMQAAVAARMEYIEKLRRSSDKDEADVQLRNLSAEIGPFTGIKAHNISELTAESRKTFWIVTFTRYQSIKLSLPSSSIDQAMVDLDSILDLDELCYGMGLDKQTWYNMKQLINMARELHVKINLFNHNLYTSGDLHG